MAKGGASLIGIDLTGGQVRMSQVSKGRGGYVLERVSVRDLPEGIFQAGRLVDGGLLSEVLREIYREGAFTAKRAVFGLNGKQSITRVISLPKMSLAATRDALSFQVINQYVPFPPADTLTDFKILRTVKQDDVESNEILLVAARRSFVEPLLKSVRSAGMKVHSVKVTGVSSLSILSGYFDADEALATAFIDIRDTTTDIGFVSGEQFRLSRTIEFGYESVLDKVASKLNLSIEEALGYLADEPVDLMATYRGPTMEDVISGNAELPVRGDDETIVSDDPFGSDEAEESSEPQAQKQVRDTVLRTMGSFVNELMRSIRYFESQTQRRQRCSRLVVFGNVQHLENVHEYLSEQTGLEVSLARPVADLDLALPSIQEEELSTIAIQLTSSVGLASDGVSSRKIELNLVPSEALTRVRTFNVIKFAVIAWILLAIFAFSMWATKQKDKRAVEAEVAHWEGEIRRIEPRYNEAVAMKNEAEGLMPPLQSLYSLVASQYPWTSALIELRTIIPDTVWLKEFEFDANGNEVEIEGTCYYPTDLMRFLVALHKSDMFVEIELGNRQRSQQARDMSGGGTRGVLGGGGVSAGGPQFGAYPTGGGMPRGGSMGESLESYFRPDFREYGVPALEDFSVKMKLREDFNTLGLGDFSTVFGGAGAGGGGGGQDGPTIGVSFGG